MDPATFVEVIKMFEILNLKVIKRHGSPCLPYLGIIRMTQTVSRCHNKNKTKKKHI